MELTAEQLQAVEKGEVVEVTIDGRRCALLNWEVYQRTQMVFDAPSQEEMAEIMERTWGDDPALDEYQDCK